MLGAAKRLTKVSYYCAVTMPGGSISIACFFSHILLRASLVTFTKSPKSKNACVFRSCPRVENRKKCKWKSSLNPTSQFDFWTQCNVLFGMLLITLQSLIFSTKFAAGGGGKKKKIQEVSRAHWAFEFHDNLDWLSRCLPRCLHVHFDRTDCNCTSRCAIES